MPETDLEQVLLHVPAGVAILEGSDFRYSYINDRLAEINGLRVEDHLGRPLADVLPTAAPDIVPRLREVMESRTPAQDHEFSTALPGDPKSVRYFVDSLFPVFGQDGNVNAVCVVVLEITERRNFQEQLFQEQLLQKQRLDSVGQLAAGVAHNFNNALTAIYGYAELLAEQFDATDPARKDLEQIQRVAEHSANLTRQLLAFSRTGQVQPSVFCLNDAIETTRDLLSPLIGDHVRICLHLDRTLPDVHCDRMQMEQAIMNLVLNARDAMPNGGAVTIGTEVAEVDDSNSRTNPEAVPGRYVRLTVIDTGTGMDEKTVARVFEPFFTTKEPGESVGLGLAMLHGTVKQSGGFVTVTSEIGVGSTFALYIPAQEQSG